MSGYGTHVGLAAIAADMAAPWRRHAACEGMWWLMDSDDKRVLATAKELCAGCPVWQPCRDFGIALPQVADPGGTIGGLSERERNTERSRRGRRTKKQTPVAPPQPPPSALVEGKDCSGCSQWKPRAAFHADRSRKDGLTTWCRPCRSEHDQARKLRSAS